VALARALAIRPRCLLLDEPLSNLDAKLRLDMRAEIRDIVKKTGITAVYVTHDQKEALSMADGIAVMSKGQLQQTGSPEDLYRRPVNRFVADFIGESNFINGQVTECRGDELCLQTSAGVIRAKAAARKYGVGNKAVAAIRPEAISFGGFGANVLQTKRVGLTYLGEMAEHLLELPDGSRFKAFELNPRAGQRIGEDVAITINPEHVTVVAE
jgi:ABC-type Fe3+/spermidine/putrescine transport system ATPase subunit